MDDEFGLAVATDLSFEQAVLRTRITMRAQGFSILSEMPAGPDLATGAGRRHLFLGMWSRLITTGNLGGAGLDVGDHLQCNVVVFEEKTRTIVAALDPSEGMEGWGGEGVAEDARRALVDLLEEVGRPEGGA